jgi:hypothetical protein
MSTTTRDLREDEEEEEEEGEGEGEESEEDEDYVPNPASADEDSDGDDDAYDEDIAEVGGAPGKTAGKKRRVAPTKAGGKKGGKASTSAAKRPRGGGIALEDEDEVAATKEETTTEADTAPAAEAKSSVDDLWASMNAESAAATSSRGAASRSSSGGVGVGAKPTAPIAAEAKPSGVDALWAELQGADAKSSRKPSSAGGALGGVVDSSTAGGGSGGGAASGGGGLDIKALLAKTSGACSSVGVSTAPSASGKMVEIQQRMDFAGEEVIVTKRVREGSQEELAYRQSRDGDASKDEVGASSKKSLVAGAFAASAELRKQMHSSSSLEFKPALPPPKLPSQMPKPTGLQGLLASIDGKKKMSTMEKSRHDWNGFKSKQDQDTRDEMERFAKDGYLAKQEFLARTDQRQAEVARTNRRRGMGMRD